MTRVSKPAPLGSASSEAPGDSGSPLFNLKHYRSPEPILHLYNQVTGKAFESECQLLEVRNRALVASLPADSVKEQNNLLLEIWLETTPPQPGPLLRATGKVFKIEPQEDSTLRVEVDLLQVDEKSWLAFLKAIETAQDEFNDFLEQNG